jgi:hypothetical protein
MKRRVSCEFLAPHHHEKSPLYAGNFPRASQHIPAPNQKLLTHQRQRRKQYNGVRTTTFIETNRRAMIATNPAWRRALASAENAGRIAGFRAFIPST